MVDLTTIKGLIFKIRATRLHLGVLRVVKAFWPFLVFAGVYFILAFFGVLDLLDTRTRAVFGVLFWLVSPFLIWRGWKAYAHPSDSEARKALDKSSDMRPIASLTDHPVEVTDDGQILWDEHTLRQKTAAERLPIPWFSALWRRLDPYSVSYTHLTLPTTPYV